jgi:hypothetical protein
LTAHLKQSRITKALTDRPNGARSFSAAEQRLSEIRVAIALMPDQAATAAGQAAALTAVNTSVKCFGSATLVGDSRAPLVKPLPLGDSLRAVVSALGGEVTSVIPGGTTHIVLIGDQPLPGTQVFVRCWWNGWNAGVVPAWDHRGFGISKNPLAGVFSGALAIREIFAAVLGYLRSGTRVSVASLWEPETDPASAAPGPERVFISSRLWFVGLGHLGQGFLWNLGMLPAVGAEAVLQDDQDAGEENEATGLITRANDIHQRKTSQLGGLRGPVGERA